MVVGFLAVLRSDPIMRGIALTGTLESKGRIEAVGGIPDKIRAAARAHYRLVLIPQGQLNDPQLDLSGLSMQRNLTLKEVNSESIRDDNWPGVIDAGLERAPLESYSPGCKREK